MELNYSVRVCACVCVRERAIVRRRRRSFWTASPGLGQYRSRFAVVLVFTNPSRPDSPRYHTSPPRGGGRWWWSFTTRARISLSFALSYADKRSLPHSPLHTHILSISRFLVHTQRWRRWRWWSLFYAYVYIIVYTYTYTCSLQHSEWMLARREF